MTTRQYREVQCSGELLNGRFEGERCGRKRHLPVDKNDNTKLFYCHSHASQRSKPRKTRG